MFTSLLHTSSNDIVHLIDLSLYLSLSLSHMMNSEACYLYLHYLQMYLTIENT